MRHITLIAVTLATACVLAGPALAGSQQEKMKTCNAEANQKGLKGTDRQAFMKTCLSAAAATHTSQQEKMKQCNSDATAQHLKGDQRKQFMSTCLKGK
jgi:hypothetical protein